MLFSQSPIELGVVCLVSVVLLLDCCSYKMRRKNCGSAALLLTALQSVSLIIAGAQAQGCSVDRNPQTCQQNNNSALAVAMLSIQIQAAQLISTTYLVCFLLADFVMQHAYIECALSFFPALCRNYLFFCNCIYVENQFSLLRFPFSLASSCCLSNAQKVLPFLLAAVQCRLIIVRQAVAINIIKKRVLVEAGVLIIITPLILLQLLAFYNVLYLVKITSSKKTFYFILLL